MKSLQFSLSPSLTSFFIMAVYHSLIICIVLDSHYIHKECCFTESICIHHLLLSTYSDCVLLRIAHYTIINRIPISSPHFFILVFVFRHLIFRFFQRFFPIALIETYYYYYYCVHLCLRRHFLSL